MPTLRRKLNWLFRDNVQVRKDHLRLADMDIRNRVPRNADIALFETNRQLDSQRLELYQANQWADQVKSSVFLEN